VTAGHTVTPNPRLTTEQAAQVALRHWGVVGSVTDVGSLEDQNLRLTGADGAFFVLKVAAAGTPGERLTMQSAAMRHFAARAEAILGPVPLAADDGRDVVADGGWTARLLTWVDGTLLSDGPLGNRRPQEALGAFAARVTKAMADFEHPGLDVPSTWDVCRSRVVVESLAGAMEPSRRELALACLAGFDAVVASTGDLPAQAAHTDVTDVNVVAAPGGRWPAPVGVLDFGDTVRTVRVADVVGTALCVAERPDVLDPLAGVAAVLTGYVRVLPLEEKEIDSVWPLLLARAAVNLAMCNAQTAATADNDYAREELERAAGGVPGPARRASAGRHAARGGRVQPRAQRACGRRGSHCRVPGPGARTGPQREPHPRPECRQ